MVDWDKIPDRLRALIRAKLGLPPEDDFFQGLIHAPDDRERTKLNTHNIYRHGYMDLLALEGGEEWALIGEWATDERHLFISEDGQRATDFINALAKKKQEEQITNVTIAQPQLQQQNEPPKKKGWFH